MSAGALFDRAMAAGEQAEWGTIFRAIDDLANEHGPALLVGLREQALAAMRARAESEPAARDCPGCALKKTSHNNDDSFTS